MATWSGEDGEPKAPDKCNEDSDSLHKIETLQLKDSKGASLQDSTPINPIEVQLSNNSSKSPEEKEIQTLDEGQLKALLDEAITYKNPKDREGKSELFKELLQEVEAKESEKKEESVGSKTQRNISSKRRRRDVGCIGQSGVGGSTTRGGSLQNLHSLSIEATTPRTKVKRVGKFNDGPNLVSARQREGGSLPSNVNVQGRDNDLTEIEKLQQRSEMICSYTSRATLEVTADQKRDDVSSNVDLAINLPIAKPSIANPMNGIEQTPLQLGSNYNSVKCLVGAPSTSDGGYSPKPMSSCEPSSSTLQPIPMHHVSLLTIPPEVLTNTVADPIAARANAEPKRPVDENGNAVGSSKLDSTTERKAKRRPKTKTDTTVLAENIEGHRGEADIDSLLNYIESTSGNVDVNKITKSKLGQSGPRNYKVKGKEDGKRRVRDAEPKLQKCNSLEEISKTKLEDLTEENPDCTISLLKPKKQVTLDDAHLGGSFNLDPLETQPSLSLTNSNKPRKKRVDGSVETLQDSEFHVVTKKQRKKKRRTGCSSRFSSKRVSGYYGGKGFPPHDGAINRNESGSLLYSYQRKGNSVSDSQPRRKSASSVPPSEKSDSSDLDSVHSLPVTSSAIKIRASGGSTPQASYADITRSVTSPPRFIARRTHHLGIKMSPSSTVPSSNASSRAGDEESVPSPEPVHTVTFIVPSPPSACTKKDAMTDTGFDLVFPALHKEYKEYPPLEKKPMQSDLFVEFTFKQNRSFIPRENSVSVERTIVLKNTPSSVQHQEELRPLKPDENLVTNNESVSSPKTETIVNQRPPVILVNDPVYSNSASDLTFGFEVNEQLLHSDEQSNLSSNKSSYSQSNAPSNRLLNYVRHEWRQVEKDLKLGKAVYYSGQ